MLRFSYAFCSPAVLTSRTTGVYMKSHARQKSKNALKRRSNFNPPSFCISAPSGSRRRPRNRRSVARFFIARPAGTSLAIKESAGCLEVTFSRGLCQKRSDSTFFLIRGLPTSRGVRPRTREIPPQIADSNTKRGSQLLARARGLPGAQQATSKQFAQRIRRAK